MGLSQNKREWLLALTLAMIVAGVGTVFILAGIATGFSWLFDKVWPAN